MNSPSIHPHPEPHPQRWRDSLSAIRVALVMMAVISQAGRVGAEEPETSHPHSTDHSELAQPAMRGLLGPYPATREASGTSWQPEAVPHAGLHLRHGEWTAMLHGLVTVVYDNQGGERGDRDAFSSNILMLMARHPFRQGVVGTRAMFSLEPLTIGRKGYPLLLQTGETANGRDPLIDRQHPHDFLMELATTYSVPFAQDSSVFVYLGLPGEPALGPPTFMHRFSGADHPEAPVTHHWLDSTHITFGVATLGMVWETVKMEGSIFRGREPDEGRWDIEAPSFDSYAARLSWNPTAEWAFQASYGVLDSPEQLEPDVDTDRATVSASYHRSGPRCQWQTTVAWGLNMNDPGRTLDGVLVESTVVMDRTHTVFGRFETVEKDELFREGEPQHDLVFRVNTLSLGYIYDFPAWHQVRWGVGGLGSLQILPGRLDSAYDETPFSFMVFVRAKL